MSMEVVTDVTRQMLLVALLVASPVLVTALVIGLIVSILQSVTQIHEMTLTFIPKILAIVGMLLLLLPWILRTLVDFTIQSFNSMNIYISNGITF
ncbi:MAG: flagellar biosynthesis protein FliQ [Candidatus Poribacteria bacterium]|nr:flagellar biosynthesis protein FliQ [Candidatus Poribacteria bacterium]